jgi:superfamily II DNA or RNA helicase
MGLISLLSDQVSSDIKRRGQALYERGEVRLTDSDEYWTDAVVSNGQAYDVELSRERANVLMGCSCSDYQSSLECCPHIWAALLAAEAKNGLRGNSKKDPKYLRPFDEDVEAWEDGYADDDMFLEGERERGWAGGSRYSPPLPSPYAQQNASSRKRQSPGWKKLLTQVEGAMQRTHGRFGRGLPPGSEIVYLVDASSTKTSGYLQLELAHHTRKKNGDWSKLKSQRIDLNSIGDLPDPADRQILAHLAGARGQNSYWSGYGYYDSPALRYQLSYPLAESLLPRLCATRRCHLRRWPDDAELPLLHWDEGGPWEFHLEVSRSPDKKQFQVQGSLRRGAERLDLKTPALLLSGGLVFWDDRVAPLQDFGAFAWIAHLRQDPLIKVPVKQQKEFLQTLMQLPQQPRLDLPAELAYQEVRPTPKPRLKVRPPQQRAWGSERLRGELTFDYDGTIVAATNQARNIFQPEGRRLIVRDQQAEQAAAERLRQLGFRPSNYYNQPPELQLTPRNLPKVVRALLQEAWHVEAEGKLYRHPGNFHVEVRSGIDWFELHGNVDFGEAKAQLPELLAALKRGENTVRLDDGTFGLLPEDWLKKYGMLAGLGKAEDGHLRFTRSQVGLLDALLAAQPEATCDAVFVRAREELRRFEGLTPSDPPSGFVGTLRGYQRDGLGWLHFLQKFGFGGCLADDMGLGKTVQVLGLLESRRELRAQTSSASDRPGPSLVVVPRSLIFNWKQEAARFTPQLRVLDHTGTDRSKTLEAFADYDLVLTTYGTLRRDALLFKDASFDYCILDEAQTVKNANTESAKAVRLLQGRHRLALSGTPVENHLGELWSLFEFLNPGMLGSASVFQLGAGGLRNPDPDSRMLLARALRPFILRRTKEQVASDLPQKTEQTIFCELESAQRKRYDELRDHYRQSLLGRIDRDGLNKSKMQILEALLRLRQAACHPGLIDKSKVGESSAKLDMLLPQLAEVVEGGHKVLVFSQFTSLLSILRHRLDRDHIPYEYLDGRTRDRQARVERFQNDEDCKLFLISLKAGGLGLNLTAAEYVFLLDPWWNPAVEAQAIDRAHRIGQTKPVFAYRIIARDTVEEKVLELQKSKRDLADAIINADNSLIRNLGREDLELLLS